MEAHLLLPSPLHLLPHRPSSSKPLPLRRRRVCISHSSSGGSSGDSSSSSPTAAEPPSTDAPPSAPPTTSSVKNRLRARNQARREPPEFATSLPVEIRRVKKKPVAAAPRREKVKVRKGWDEMSLAEKAMELYVGEKGALFWLNKFAYASIFIMIGAWFLFRFIGPSIGLYQLDAPPLAPTAVFTGAG